MKYFQITFIPKSYARKDDPSDGKQWDYFEGDSKKAVMEEVGQHSQILSCSEVTKEDVYG